MHHNKAASEDLIMRANNKPTVDDMRSESERSKGAEARAFYEKTRVLLTAGQRRQLKKVMSKAGKDILGNPLIKGGA